jgi:putative inorganic carbon (HCO3(-)) transporter
MRDLIVTLIVLGSLPLILRTPVVGALMWIWISVMNPHTQGWGFATQFPFAQLIGVTTMASMVFTSKPRALPITALTCALLAFIVWMNVTLPFSLYLDESIVHWNKVMKIMLMTLVCIMLIKSRRDIDAMVWVLAFSLGYYGVKGGVFTLRNGGGERVWGPEGTFIGDNNALALALIMIIPLMYYLLQQETRRWRRHLLVAAMLLCALAALGSYSRGGLLAIAAMGVFMWYKSAHKGVMGGVMLCAAPLLLLFMPEQWSSRMDSINDYQQDASAMGRINAWYMAWNLASDRFFGGGFEIYEPGVFAQYAPDPLDIHAAHSIYFQVLGEHGFVGLGLYLLVGIVAWRHANWISTHARDQPALRWAASLAAMIQTSLVGFAVGGAFLSLLYFDVPYYLLGAIVATRAVVQQSQPGPRER